MPITENDIKLLKSELMQDTDDGGGRMTGNEVVDGESNNMFPDVSELDRTYGRVSLRKVFPAVLTDDTDTYYGANMIISEPPSDPLVHATVFRTGTDDAWYNHRVDAQNKVESYVVVGTLSPMRLIGDHYEGQRSILAYQMDTDPLPAVGDVYALVEGSDQQYVRVQAVEHRSVVYYDDQGPFERTELTLTISDPLRRTFDGGSPSRYSSYQPPTTIHRTNIVEAVAYYGVSPLAQAASFGDRQVHVDDYKSPLIPSTQAESSVLDIQAGGMRSITIDAGARDVEISQVAHTFMINVSSANRGYNYVAQLLPKPKPGTLEISYRARDKWYVVYDQAGDGSLSGDGAGTISYSTGSVSVTLKDMPDVDTAILFGWGAEDVYLVGSGADVATPTYTHTVADPPIKPGSVVISWDAGGETKTVTDGAGDGILSGDGSGYVIYSDGLVRVTPTSLPDPSTTPQISYDRYDKVQETFEDVDPVNGEITVTLSQQPEPGTLSITWRVNFHYEGYPDSEAVGLKPDNDWLAPDYDHHVAGGAFRWASDGVIVESDNEDGVLPWGSIDFASNTITLPGEIPEKFHVPVWEWRDLGDGTKECVVSNYEEHETTTYAVRCTVQVEYSVVGAATASHTEQMAAQQLRIHLAPRSAAEIVPASLQFTIGSAVYIDNEGVIVKDPDPDTGAGTDAGTIDYSTGMATVTLWDSGPPTFDLQSMLLKVTKRIETTMMFRTTGAPCRPGSFTVSVTASDGDLLTAAADLNGDIMSDYIQGHIDVHTGIVSLSFGCRVLASSLTEEEKQQSWYDPSLVDQDGYIWKPRSVIPETCRYNVVVYVYLPLSEDILGLDPVRLPMDGRVPIFRVGDVIVVHHTQTTTIDTPTNGQVIDTGRVRLAWARLYDANDDPVPTDRYTVDLDAGTVTLDNVEDLAAPLRLEDRIEDMALVSDLQINGTLTLTRSLSHDYPDGSYVSSALIIGDMFARVTNIFSQQTWTGEWSDDRIGSDTSAKYNSTVYPIEVTNKGAIQERWACIFNNSTQYRLIGEYTGQIAEGDINTDFAPLNPETGVPYFTIRAGGWGTGWATGNVLRINTIAANYPVWVARTVLQGDTSAGEDKFRLCIRGDVDTP